jgi:hypothetical protein
MPYVADPSLAGAANIANNGAYQDMLDGLAFDTLIGEKRIYLPAHNLGMPQDVVLAPLPVPIYKQPYPDKVLIKPVQDQDDLMSMNQETSIRASMFPAQGYMGEVLW